MASQALLQTGELSPVKSFIGVGDPYTNKQDRPLHSDKGVRQFGTQGPKSGVNENWSSSPSKVNRLYEGETYQDMSKLTARDRLKSREKFIEPKGFIPSSPAKTLTGAGTYDGAFTKYEHSAEPIGLARDEVPKRAEPKPRNFVTAPPKKGTFGFANTTFSPLPEYKTEPYKPKQRPTRTDHTPEGMPPFKPASAARATLDTAEHAPTTASKVYKRDDACLPPKPDPTEGKTKKELVEAKEEGKGWEKPFVQSHPGKSGYNATFQPFPTYSSEEYDPKKVHNALAPMRLAPTSKRKKYISPALQDRPAFKPSSGSKSGLTKSIARGGIFRATIGRSIIAGRRGR